MRLAFACASFLGLALAAGAASAQSFGTDLDISFNAAVTSDYVFRGVSQTDEGPAVQAGVDVTAGAFYVGAWGSTVDFGDGTDAEFNLYGGFTGEAAGYEWSLGGLGYLYSGAPGGSDYDFFEVQASVSRAVGAVTVGAFAAYSPDFYGLDDKATYLEANVEVEAHPRLTLSAALGYQWLDVSDDYATWNFGAAYAITETLAFDIRYHQAEVAGPLGGNRVAFTLAAAF